MPPADHPIWKTLNTAVLGGLLLAFLWLNATKFDKTEVTAFLEIMGSYIGYQVVQHKMEKRST